MPKRVSGPPPLDAARRSTWEPRGSFLLALDGARARFGAPPLDAARRRTWEPRGSFLLAGAALQALDGARARFGAPPLDAALGSLAARFCWQGQHFRLWTVPERVSGPPPLDAARRSTWEPRSSFLLAGQHFRLWTVPERVSGPPPLMLPGAALGSLAARFCWQGQHFRLWTVPERVSLDGTRARFGAPPPLMLPGAALGLAPPLLDAVRRSTWKPRGSFLLAGAALQALDGARARFGAPAARRSTWEPRGSGSGLVAARTHVDTHIITIEIGSPQAVSATLVPLLKLPIVSTATLFLKNTHVGLSGPLIKERLRRNQNAKASSAVMTLQVLSAQ